LFFGYGLSVGFLRNGCEIALFRVEFCGWIVVIRSDGPEWWGEGKRREGKRAEKAGISGREGRDYSLNHRHLLIRPQ
jgi:hypothetical protein